MLVCNSLASHAHKRYDYKQKEKKKRRHNKDRKQSNLGHDCIDNLLDKYHSENSKPNDTFIHACIVISQINLDTNQRLEGVHIKDKIARQKKNKTKKKQDNYTGQG